MYLVPLLCNQGRYRELPEFELAEGAAVFWARAFPLSVVLPTLCMASPRRTEGISRV